MAFVVTVGITPADAQSPSGTDHKSYTTAEQCFECHGAYTERAQATASLGDWNPHDSIHGGYVDCMNCHTEDRLDRNYCAYCHEYKPAEQKK